MSERFIFSGLVFVVGSKSASGNQWITNDGEKRSRHQNEEKLEQGAEGDDQIAQDNGEQQIEHH